MASKHSIQPKLAFGDCLRFAGCEPNGSSFNLARRLQVASSNLFAACEFVSLLHLLTAANERQQRLRLLGFAPGPRSCLKQEAD